MSQAQQTEILKVTGMTCKHCQQSVEQAALGVSGVNSAMVDLAAGTLKITYLGNGATLEKVRAAIDDVGFEVV